MRKVLWVFFSVVVPGTICFAREPECSRFHYDEKLLEKMIRSEFKMDAIEDTLKTVTDSMEERIQTVSDVTNTVEDLKKEMETLKTAYIETLKRVETLGTAHVTSSSIYTRWGRRLCPGSAELVYEGFAGGGHYTHQGGSSNYICLPKDPILEGDGRRSSSVNVIYGAEYETSDATFHSNLHNHDVPCAVCQVVERSIVMIPARNVCYSGWHTEYSGHLMSSYHGHVGNKDVVCMDGSPEEAEGNDSGDQNGALFYFVQIGCGALKCPPYRENVALTCVVCSK